MRNRWPSEIRLVAFAASFVAMSWVVVWRLGQLQIGEHDYYVERAQGQHYKKIVIQPERGEILDAKGRILATSVGRLSVYADPTKLVPENTLGDDDEAKSSQSTMTMESWAGLFSESLGVPYSDILGQLQKKHPVPLARRLPPEETTRILGISDEYRLRENALWFHRETVRVYPRKAAPHVIGFCTTDGDGDNQGIAGVELLSDEDLKGCKLSMRLQRSAIRTVLSPVEDAALRQARGETLVLTIDAAVQEAAEQVLARKVEEFKAEAGVVIVQETKTGAIRAMASWPTFDNNRFSEAGNSERRNRCLTDPIEPGSVAKIFTMSILFDLSKYGPDDTIDCHGGFVRIHGRNVIDAPGHTLHVALLREVFQFSSNVGTVLAAQALEPAEYYDSLRRFGFGRTTGIDLPGEGAGLLYPVERWTAMSMSSLPMGYEFGLTPIQIVTAVSGILNDGRLMRPYVVAERHDPRGGIVWKAQPVVVREVVRPSTSALIRELMEEVVVSGTGKKAQVAQYRTGGKTGTTRKSQIKDHAEYISSFVGAVPIDNPELTIFCSIDNPKGHYYAAEVAAPVFQEVGTAALAQLAIPSTGAPKLAVASHDEEEEGIEGGAGDQTNKAALAAAPPAERIATGPGEMPDLTGLTMAEARNGLKGFELDVRFIGSGCVVDQSPIPGTPVTKDARAIVVFGDSTVVPPDALEALQEDHPETRKPSAAPSGKGKGVERREFAAGPGE